MKLTIEQQQLSNLIASPTSVVEAKNTIPILGHIKITAHDGSVSVMASDLDIEAVTTSNLDIDQPGECTVPAKPFEAIIKRMSKSAMVSLEYTGGKLSIKSGRSKFNLQSLPVGDFPQLATGEYTQNSKIDAQDFLRLLTKVKFAMSTEEMRYYLNGVYIHNDESGDLIAVATDGARCAKMTYAGDCSVSGVIIPRKTVDRLCKALDGVDGNVSLDTSETKIRITGEGFSITSKVIDGTFPEYGRVFPSSIKAEMKVDAKEFNAATSSVAAVSDNRSKAVRLSISNDTCELMGRGDIGDAVTEVAVAYDGDPLDVVFNSAYTADFMSQAENGSVTLGLGGPMDPALVKFDECSEFLGVLMPMRI